MRAAARAKEAAAKEAAAKGGAVKTSMGGESPRPAGSPGSNDASGDEE